MIDGQRLQRLGCIALALVALGAEAQSPSPYPLLPLNGQDPLFKQYQAELEAFHRARARGQPPPPILFFRVQVPPGMDLLGLSARVGHRYDTLATLNLIDRANEPLAGKEILVPSQGGLFLHREERSGLQHWIRSGRIDSQDNIEIRVHYAGEWREVLFFPDQALNPVERAWFLGILRVSPLAGALRPIPNGRISSRFGMRLDPFTGHPQFHNGVDLAAPEGTPVLAAAAGKVVFAGERDVYGLLVVLQHEDGYESWYGHLRTIRVRLNQMVPSGYVLGEVGTTGRTTGPHLHFEIRRHGAARDPVPYWKER